MDSNIIKNLFQYSTKRSINKSLNNLSFSGEEIKINLVDVGAAGDVEERWKYLSNNLNYIGFEPDDRSRLLLKNDNNTIKLKYLGICLIYRRFDLIDQLIKLSDNDFKLLADPFLISLRSLKRKNIYLRRINFYFQKLMILFFPNFKSHPLY